MFFLFFRCMFHNTDFKKENKYKNRYKIKKQWFLHITWFKGFIIYFNKNQIPLQNEDFD